MKTTVVVDGNTMRAIAPQYSGERARRQAKIIGDVGPVLQSTLESYAIKTPLRIAHFLAQTCLESDGFSTTVEYSDGRYLEGRKDLGNIHTGDGPRYKGRGLLQLTGRSNYRNVGKALDIDLEDHPELAADPVLSLRIACEYWKRRKINTLCDRDDVVAVTRAVQGGDGHLKERIGYLAKAKAALAGKITPPVLRRGSFGGAVATLQTMLVKVGFDLAIDQDFGPATEAAVKRFQQDHNLEIDGIVGPATWNALE